MLGVMISNKMDRPVDPNWTIHNDRQSVTVGINTRLWLCRKKGLRPTLVRLGREHSRLFWAERGVPYIPNGPTPLISGDVSWDDGEKYWLYGSLHVPMRFNDKKVIGIAVESEPRPP